MNTKAPSRDPLDAVTVTTTSMLTIRQSMWVAEQANKNAESKGAVIRRAIDLAMRQESETKEAA